MGDVERVTTTERHAELRDELACAIHQASGQSAGGGVDCRSCLELADAVLPFIEQAKGKGYAEGVTDADPFDWWRFVRHLEADTWTPSCRCDECKNLRPFYRKFAADERVWVVEGLVATIKALPHGWVETGVDDGQGHREGFEATEWTRLLAVVEAREDTT